MKRVYFIKPIGMTGPVKIGCSASPEGRRAALATWSPFALEIIAEIEGGFDLERRFHALFMDTHLRREWFGWSKRMAAVVEAIRDGSFETNKLPAALNVSAAPRKGKGSRAAEWDEYRRFSTAYGQRLYALRKRGMPSDWGDYIWCPSSYGLKDPDYLAKYHSGKSATEVIRQCEAFAQKASAEFGHKRMKPVKWRGAYPDERPAQGIAA